MIVQCCHCEEDISIFDADAYEMKNSDGVIEDYCCPNCGKMMDIVVEIQLVGEGKPIERVECDCCHKLERVGKMYNRKRSYPFPNDPRYRNICGDCFASLIRDARNDIFNYTDAYSDEYREKIRDIFTPGTAIMVGKVTDPYYGGGKEGVVEKVKDCGVVVANIKGKIVLLAPGLDEIFVKA